MLSLQQLQEKGESYIAGYLEGFKEYTCHVYHKFINDRQFQKGYLDGYSEVTKYKNVIKDKSFAFVCGFDRGCSYQILDGEMLDFFKGTEDYLNGFLIGSDIYKSNKDFDKILSKVEQVKREQEARDYVRQNQHLFTSEVFSALGVQTYIDEQNKTKLKKKLTEMP